MRDVNFKEEIHGKRLLQVNGKPVSTYSLDVVDTILVGISAMCENNISYIIVHMLAVGSY